MLPGDQYNIEVFAFSQSQKVLMNLGTYKERGVKDTRKEIMWNQVFGLNDTKEKSIKYYLP